jgi:hypothetical protein
MESIYGSEPSVDNESTVKSGMESTVDDMSTATPKHPVNAVAMANGLFDTERTPSGQGHRRQSRTCCRNRQSRQSNRYLAHDACPLFGATPAFQNQTRLFLTGCSRAAQSRGVSQGANVPGLFCRLAAVDLLPLPKAPVTADASTEDDIGLQDLPPGLDVPLSVRLTRPAPASRLTMRVGSFGSRALVAAAHYRAKPLLKSPGNPGSRGGALKTRLECSTHHDEEFTTGAP